MTSRHSERSLRSEPANRRQGVSLNLRCQRRHQCQTKNPRHPSKTISPPTTLYKSSANKTGTPANSQPNNPPGANTPQLSSAHNASVVERLKIYSVWSFITTRKKFCHTPTRTPHYPVTPHAMRYANSPHCYSTRSR